MSVLYLAFLLASIGCMALIDWRYRLFFWRDAVRATLVLSIGLVFFLIWDFVGIGLGIFAIGETTIMTGIVLAPELPLEEPVFLLFLCYLTMVLVMGFHNLFTRRERSRS